MADEVSDDKEKDALSATMTTLIAIVQGDRWLSADACAVYLGLKPTSKGLPNRRGFLERIACRPDFPRPLELGGQEKAWRKSEVDEWALEQRRVSRAA